MEVKEILNQMFLAKALQASMLNIGQLAPPRELANCNGSWTLRGVLHMRMFAVAQAAAVASWQADARIVCSQSIAHLVLRHRLGDWEHRFVVPVAGPAVAAMLAHPAPLDVVLAASVGAGHVHLSMPQGWNANLHGAGADRAASAEQRRCALHEVLANCLCVSSDCSGLPAVADACVSYAMPPEPWLFADEGSRARTH